MSTCSKQAFLTLTLIAVAASPVSAGQLGYWLVNSQGGVFGFDAPFHGSLPGLNISPSAPIVGMDAAPSSGYWLVGSDGGVYGFGAPFHGSLAAANISPSAPIVGMASTPNGNGYWLVGSDGNVYGFGVQSRGSLTAQNITPSAPIVGAASTPSGNGYWLVGADGSVYGFGDASFRGSLTSIQTTPSAPIVGMARTPSGNGYWLAASNGTVYSFGDATNYGGLGGPSGFGSLGGLSDSGGPGPGGPPGQLPAPVVGIESTPSGGYWLATANGGVFPFGGAPFLGSLEGNINPNQPIVGIEGTLEGLGLSQSDPFLPTFVTTSGSFVFTDVKSGLWFDPPVASGFDYQMTSGALFTQIDDFPTGFNSPFTISSGGVILGTGSPGTPFVFPNGGVSEFQITGIDPAVDASDPSAFPLELEFSTPTASFTMTSLPEPASLVLLGIGAVACCCARRWRSSYLDAKT